MITALSRVLPIIYQILHRGTASFFLNYIQMLKTTIFHSPEKDCNFILNAVLLPFQGFLWDALDGHCPLGLLLLCQNDLRKCSPETKQD